MSSSSIAHSHPIISSKLTDVSHSTFTALIRVKNEVSILLYNIYHHVFQYIKFIFYTVQIQADPARFALLRTAFENLGYESFQPEDPLQLGLAWKKWQQRIVERML